MGEPFHTNGPEKGVSLPIVLEREYLLLKMGPE